MAESGKSKKNRLQVLRVVDVPLREVSGICLRRGRNGRMALVAVGDRVSKIAWFFRPHSDEGQIDWKTSDIAERSGSLVPKDGSQIEAVCADGHGRVLLLQEAPPRVELFDPKALEVSRRSILWWKGSAKLRARGPTRRGRGAREWCFCPAGICSSPRRRSRRHSLSLARRIPGREA
jgi:hypothetical protein